MILSLPRDIHLEPGAPLRPIPLPGSKSVTNRALLLAALAPGVSVLRGGLEAEDTRWMRASLNNLGIAVVEEAGGWRIQGGLPPRTQSPLWLGASGTTLRFLLPMLALHGQGLSFHLTGEHGSSSGPWIPCWPRCWASASCGSRRPLAAIS